MILVWHYLGDWRAPKHPLHVHFSEANFRALGLVQSSGGWMTKEIGVPVKFLSDHNAYRSENVNT